MIFNQDVDLAPNYETRPAAQTGLPWEVLVSRAGTEPVVLVHELPGITPAVVSLAEALRLAGFKVYMPSLFGRPGANPSAFTAGVDSVLACVRSDIAAFARGEETRGVVTALRSLARQASQDAGGRAVGVIGLCLSGGFAVATATEPLVAAAVASEPSLPLYDDRHIDIGPEDQETLRERVDQGQLRVMLLRFQGDTISPCARVRRLGEIVGPTLAARCLPDEAADPAWHGSVRHHCVLTNELVVGPGSLTEAARNEVIAFFAWRLRGGQAPTSSGGIPNCLEQGCQAHREDGPAAPIAS